MRSRERGQLAAARRRLGLKAAATGGLLFLNLPLAFIVLYAFTTDDRSFTFPPPGLTLNGSRSPGAAPTSGRRSGSR